MSHSLPSSYNPQEGESLRVSKSSFMKYFKCPRQYAWSYILLPDVRPPPNDLMIRGTSIHKVLENLYDSYYPGDTIADTVAILDDVPFDPAVDAMIEIEQQRLEVWGVAGFEPVSHEEKLEIPSYEEMEDGTMVPIILVGLPDAILRHPDGGLCIVELKTGELNSSKMGRIRKELCFYANMLEILMPGEEVTHFGFFSPDCMNENLMVDTIQKGKKEVFTGENQGILIIEKANKRSMNSFRKNLKSMVHGVVSRQWPMKWSDYYCTEWCEYHLNCESEMLGISEAIEIP